MPALPGFSLGGQSIPCELVAGDYYDFIPWGEGRLVVAVADVSSHGVGPALLMSALRASLRARTGDATAPDELISILNSLVARDVPADGFVTMLLGTVHPESQRFVYASAGHDLPLLYRAASGTFEELPSTGVPLGVLEEADFELGPQVALEPGDILALSTDGVWEAGSERGSPFGRTRLRELIRANRQKTAAGIVHAVISGVKRYTMGVLHDDVTLVVIKRQ